MSAYGVKRSATGALDTVDHHVSTPPHLTPKIPITFFLKNSGTNHPMWRCSVWLLVFFAITNSADDFLQGESGEMLPA